MNRLLVFAFIGALGWFVYMTPPLHVHAQEQQRHLERTKVYVGLSHCSDDSSWYVSDADADHVTVVCTVYVDGPEPKKDDETE